MGCDCHMYVEKRIEGKWVSAEAMLPDENGLLQVPYPQQVYTGRNYALFGFLTEGKVRQDIGIYVGKLKDFPADACKELQDIFISWAGDAHTPNWLTLKELQDVDWKQLVLDDDKEVPLSVAFEHFYWDVVMRLPFYSMGSKPEDIRIVFWFDN